MPRELTLPSSVLRAPTNPRPLADQVPMDAEEYEYLMDGLDPEVQLFNVNPDQEMKVKPNYSDYLQWKEQQLAVRRALLDQGVSP